ncbi:hypothetical protein [Thalassotalea litorea]|uniref:hypothetical protein n=1 Tax=Thalassotalea litorea TaxID=2020715 RepID=UPI0037362722
MNQSLLFNDDFQTYRCDSTVTFSGMANGRRIQLIVTFKSQPIPASGILSEKIKLDLEALVEDWTEDHDLDEATEIHVVY